MPNIPTLNPDEILYEEDDQFEHLPIGQKKIYYLYELKKLIKGKSDSLLTFSPNSVNIVIIDKDEYVTFDAWKPDAQIYEYRTRQSVSNIDGEIDIAQYLKEDIISNIDLNGGLKFSNDVEFKYSRQKLYLVSEFLLETDDDITNFGYLIQKMQVDSVLTENMLGNKHIEIVDLDTWAARDSNNAIFKIGKQLDNFEVTEISFNAPSSFMLDSIKVLGINKNKLSYSKIKLKHEMTPLWMCPIEKLDSGEINFLNYWMSEKVLTIKEAKKFISDNGIDLSSLINIDTNEDEERPRPWSYSNISSIDITFKGTKIHQQNINRKNEIVDDFWDEESLKGNQKITISKDSVKGFNIGTKYKSKTTGSFTDWKRDGGRILKQTLPKDVSVSTSSGTYLKSYRDVNITSQDIEISFITKDKFKKSSINDLLLEVLTASFNFNNNFKGAGYKDQQTGELNKIALYKQEFDGKNIIEYINSVEKKWEKTNPNLVDSVDYKNYKIIRSMLSGYCYGNMSINGGMNDDYKALLPYYFELLTTPKWMGVDGSEEDDGSEIWKYTDTIIVKLKSNYFDFINNEMVLKNKVISKKAIINMNGDSWFWPSIPKIIESSSLASLSPIDFKLSDENVGKFLLLANKKIIDFIGTSDSLIKIDLDSFDNLLTDDHNAFDVIVNSTNPKSIEISGIFGSGSWDIKLIGKLQDKNNINIDKNVDIKKLSLFKINKQAIGTIILNI